MLFLVLYFVCILFIFFFFQAEDGIRDRNVTGVLTCALPISMIEKVIAWSIRRRELVALGALFVLVAGIWLLRTMPVDAIPDLSDTQVIVYSRSEERRVGKECRSRMSA